MIQPAKPLGSSEAEDGQHMMNNFKALHPTQGEKGKDDFLPERRMDLGGDAQERATEEALVGHVRAVCDRVTASIEPAVRDASDRLYSDLLSAVQDYLTDNAAFNIGARIDSAQREAGRLRAEVLKLRGALQMCVDRFERPQMSPDANVVLERARAALGLPEQSEAGR